MCMSLWPPTCLIARTMVNSRMLMCDVYEPATPSMFDCENNGENSYELLSPSASDVITHETEKIPIDVR